MLSYLPFRVRLNGAAIVALLGLTLGLSACDRAPQAPAAPDGVPTGDSQKTAAKVDICHVDVTGRFLLISIKANGWPEHQAHGDGLPLGPVPGGGGSVFDAACVSQPPVGKRVFVSSTSSSADLGGFAGADSTCQALATAADLGGTWRAWLTGTTSSAFDRLQPWADGPYHLIDGTVIATDGFSFASGSVEHLRPINMDENGGPVLSAEVWTGGEGSDDPTSCSNFTASDNIGEATVGLSQYSDFRWAKAYSKFCDRLAHLYCIEQ